MIKEIFRLRLRVRSVYVYPKCTVCFCAGIKGTYQGLRATMMKQGSNQAIRFFVVESLKDWYRGGDNKKSVPKLITGCFGAIAGAASVFGNTPLDVIKTRMQVHGSVLKSARFRSVHCKPQFIPRERRTTSITKELKPKLAFAQCYLTMV